MEAPPRARGPGRSGPRRRTGCLTCRARKVRCDEAKPTCANCTRLRLQCIYKSVIISGVIGRPSRPRSRSSGVTQEPGEVTDPSFLRTVLQPTNSPSRSPPAQFQPQQQAPLPSSGPADSGFANPFDMLGFIGEITSDFQQKHHDLTNHDTISSSPIAGVDGGVFHDERQMTWGSGEIGVVAGLSDLDTPGSTEGLVWEEQLLNHFRESEPPPTIFGPVELEWKYVRDVMVAQSSSCRALLMAIYCYSDIHKAWVERIPWRLGPAYHQQASSEVQSCLLGEVSEPVLKQIVTTVLLLMLTELFPTNHEWRPATSFLHSAYLILQRFHRRTQLWTGSAYLIVSWVSLLDVRALIAGRDGDTLAELGNLDDLERDITTTPAADGPLGEVGDGKDDLLSQPEYLIQNAIVGPAFQFFLQTQQVVRRIVCIDLHHRSRGTVSDEFEVLQLAHQIGTDLETLWNRRPRVLDVYNQPEALFNTLSPHLATTICRTFRQYVANFLALFIYLHRVAFAIYPRTDRVYRAVDQIIQLAKVESRHHQHLPTSFVWPLFVAGLEGSGDQRSWIVQEIQHMASLSSSSNSPAMNTMATTAAVRHPNAAKALLLLEEMTRRQDASRTWADSRHVRRELFTDFFVMI